MIAVPTCLACVRQVMARALSRAWAKTGNRMAARIAMIAITTRSSISVKPGLRMRGIACLLSVMSQPLVAEPWLVQIRPDASRGAADAAESLNVRFRLLERLAGGGLRRPRRQVGIAARLPLGVAGVWGPGLVVRASPAFGSTARAG